jgi:ferredoxin
MRIGVNEHVCSGQGRCYTLAAELLSSDDEGFVTLKGSSMEVPLDLEHAARTAMNACPEDAITLSDS